MTLAPGIHLAHKPRGATSSSLVREAQEALRREHAGPLPICHGGALDPFAEGLLLLLVGPAARLMEELHPIPKHYEAVIAWGAETDTGDGAGKIVFAGDPSGLAEPMLEEKLRQQLGWQEQIPPATSNKRVGGERAYAKAWRGETVELPPSRVYLHEARFTAHELPRSSRLTLACRGGYYVRALARDLGRALGCGAHLTELKRTQIGPWRDPLGEDPGPPICGRELLPWLPSRELTEAEASAAELKRPIPRAAIVSGPFALPGGFPGPGAAPRDRAAPIRGFVGDTLRVLLRPRGDELVLHTDLNGGL